MTGRRIGRQRIRSRLRQERLWPFSKIADARLKRLQGSAPDNLVPLSSVLAARRLALGADALPHLSARHSLAELNDPELAAVLGSREPGGWALSPDAIALLRREVVATSPSLVLEFGSGLSTLCLAFFAARYASTSEMTVLSLDQEESHAARTARSLEEAGLSQYAQVIHAPIKRQLIGDRWGSAYAIPDELRALVGTRNVELVLVDGPAAEAGARYATLPAVRDLLAPGTVIFLDDALRDGELETARQWAQDGWVEVDGIYLTEKGLLRAHVR